VDKRSSAERITGAERGAGADLDPRSCSRYSDSSAPSISRSSLRFLASSAFLAFLAFLANPFDAS
jgi:hypothetical protein